MKCSCPVLGSPHGILPVALPVPKGLIQHCFPPHPSGFEILERKLGVNLGADSAVVVAFYLDNIGVGGTVPVAVHSLLHKASSDCHGLGAVTHERSETSAHGKFIGLHFESNVFAVERSASGELK